MYVKTGQIESFTVAHTFYTKQCQFKQSVQSKVKDDSTLPGLQRIVQHLWNRLDQQNIRNVINSML